MFIARSSLWAFAFSFCILTNLVSAQELSPRESALRFAGLSEAGSNAPSKAFQNQAKTAWESYEKKVGQPLQAWVKKEVAYAGGGTVFYPFSGPDFLTVARIYPSAERYVLVAIQRARKPSAPEKMQPNQRAAFEKRFGTAWDKFGKLGFFRTDDLNDDQQDKHNGVGVTSILMAFAARLGYEVSAVSPLTFNANKGVWEVQATDEKWNSVRLSLQKNGAEVTLDYLCVDLSDKGLNAAEPLRIWIQGMSANPTLLKAASHLLQKKSFSVLRDALVSRNSLLVQDETGLEYSDLKKIGPVRLYGNFAQTYILFTSTTQRTLAAAYKAEKSPGELPFAFSYLKKSGLRSMQIARRPGPH